MQLSPGTVITRSPDQISGDLDGSVMLMSIGNGEYYCLEGVGNRIWALLEQPITVGEIVNRLLSEFDVPRERAEQEVAAFLHQLQQKQLISIQP